MKRIVVVWLILMLLTTKAAMASGFHISSIGGVSTGGQQLSHWWISRLRPVFEGEATPGAEITVTIDSASVVIYADSSGDWQYQPENDLTAGDHQVSFASSGSTVSFTLTLGTDNVDWNMVSSGATETLPTVGFFLPTLALLGGGGGLMVLGKKLREN